MVTSLVYYTAYTRSQLCEEFVERYGFLATGVSGPHSTAREMAEVREEREEKERMRVCLVCHCVQEVMVSLVGGVLSNTDLAEDSYAIGTSLVFMT